MARDARLSEILSSYLRAKSVARKANIGTKIQVPKGEQLPTLKKGFVAGLSARPFQNISFCGPLPITQNDAYGQ